MAEPSARAEWEPHTDAPFSFEPDVPSHWPRAWERAPKSPYSSRHKGRKVWKRYDPPGKGIDEDLGKSGEVSTGDGEPTTAALGDTTNTPRPVKRLRLKNVPGEVLGGKENRPLQYFPTLHDKATGTPRRKQASRKSLKPDRTKAVVQSLEEQSEVKVDTAGATVQDDPLQVPENLAVEDSRELLSTAERQCSLTEAGEPIVNDEIHVLDTEAPGILDTATVPDTADEASVVLTPAVSPEASVIEASISPLKQDDPEIPTEDVRDVASPRLENGITEALQSIHTTPTNMQDLQAIEIDSDEGEQAAEFPVLHQNITLTPGEAHFDEITNPSTPAAITSSPKSSGSDPELASLHAVEEHESPQIGASLLRRESLRSKESSAKRARRSPRKRDTLQRRDTLQEREILQKVIAESSPESNLSNVHQSEAKIAAPLNCASTVDIEAARRESEISADDGLHLQGNHDNIGVLRLTESILLAEDETKAEEDPSRDIEGLEIRQDCQDNESKQEPLDTLPDETQLSKAIKEANKSITKVKVDEAIKASQAAKEPRAPEARTTRSESRFSDDTSMLRDFLNRAQANKAAKAPFFPAPEILSHQISPRRSPRKALTSRSGSASLTQNSRDIGIQPGTPPEKSKVDGSDIDDVGNEIDTEPASCRRSTRTRLLVPSTGPSKGPPGAPSFIPVRRADGTDHVVLQKSQAQELALVTRANTRRNKGQSKPPQMALKDLPANTTEVTSVRKKRAVNSRSVAWAETLANYQGTNDQAEEVEEARPKVRRLRGLGAANGTPAPKRTSTIANTSTHSASNGTPARKRRGKGREALG